MFHLIIVLIILLKPTTTVKSQLCSNFSHRLIGNVPISPAPIYQSKNRRLTTWRGEQICNPFASLSAIIRLDLHASLPLCYLCLRAFTFFRVFGSLCGCRGFILFFMNPLG
jgi:hypothetical protein